MVEIEKETSPKLLPFWLLILPVAIAFTLVSLYLILYLSLRPNFDVFLFFCVLFIPAMALLLSDTLLFYLRSKQLMNYLKRENEIVKNAEDKMQALKEKYRSFKA